MKNPITLTGSRADIVLCIKHWYTKLMDEHIDKNLLMINKLKVIISYHVSCRVKYITNYDVLEKLRTILKECLDYDKYHRMQIEIDKRMYSPIYEGFSEESYINSLVGHISILSVKDNEGNVILDFGEVNPKMVEYIKEFKEKEASV